MGVLSSSVSVARYNVKGNISEPIIETVRQGLKKNVIPEITDDTSEKTAGWTSFENPFRPDFEDSSSFVMGNYLIFSLRIDTKTVPSKAVKKDYTLEVAKRLAESGRERLSRNEKRLIKEDIINAMLMRVPAIPNIYELIWNIEESWLWFFSTRKSANEELETLFSKSFSLSLTRLFPYTIAYLLSGLSESDIQILSETSPTTFTE